MRCSSIALAYWRIANQSKRRHLLDQFWDHLVEGHQLERSDPIFKLRAKLGRECARTGRNSKQHLWQTLFCAWIIQAWNCWSRGQTSIGFKWDLENRLPDVK